MVRVKERLQDLRVTPKKNKGQNFLVDRSVLYSILDFAKAKPEEDIIEIGPGLGALTEQLYKIKPLTVIEIEEAFCLQLQARFPKLKVLCSDVRDVDFAKLGSNLTIFGNIPYVYSTDIIFHILAHAPSIKRAVLLLQKEFVDRMAAAPGGKTYGSLSIACQLWADVFPGPLVDGASFHPPTKVISRLVELRLFNSPRFPLPDLQWFRIVVRAAFSERRKKLSNSLRGLMHGRVEVLRDLLQGIGIDPGRRAETLSLEEFVILSNALRVAVNGQEKRH